MSAPVTPATETVRVVLAEGLMAVELEEAEVELVVGVTIAVVALLVEGM